ncbi:Panacea domain-containing protein [Aeromonas sp. s4]|uniref:Panacea domain-containing protein n=1 Tax=Aeromonas sp. s4 TaxID=3138486 RepID=UPI0034A30031
MTTEFDIAKYILRQQGEMSAMKLQKLVYYSQAWSLVWDEEPLFETDFQAWANGPVLPTLYNAHRGMFKVNEATFTQGSPDRLSAEQRDTVDKVLEFYGDKTAQWLSNLTHQESPWVNARKGLPAMTVSNEVITQAAMEEYYSAL